MFLLDWTASLTFSRTVKDGKTLVSWKDLPIPSFVRMAGEKGVISCPLKKTFPSEGEYCPEIILKKVVLPAPFGPIMDLNV